MAPPLHKVPRCLGCGARRTVASPSCPACGARADLVTLEPTLRTTDGFGCVGVVGLLAAGAFVSAWKLGWGHDLFVLAALVAGLGALFTLSALAVWVTELRTRLYQFYDIEGRMGFAEVAGRRVHARSTRFAGKPIGVPQTDGAELLAWNRIHDRDEPAIAEALVDLGFSEWSAGGPWVRVVASWMGMLRRGEIELLDGTSAVWETTAGFYKQANPVTGLEVQEHDDGELTRWSWKSLGVRLGPNDGTLPKAMPLVRRIPRDEVPGPLGAAYRELPQAVRPAYDVQALDHRDRTPGWRDKVPTIPREVVDPLPAEGVGAAMRAFWEAADEPLRRALRAIYRISRNAMPPTGREDTQ